MKAYVKLKGSREGGVLSIVCPNCAKELRTSQDLGGKRVRCPKCREVFTVSATGVRSLPAPTADQPAPPAVPTPRRIPVKGLIVLFALMLAAAWVFRPTEVPESPAPAVANTGNALPPVRTTSVKKSARPTIPADDPRLKEIAEIKKKARIQLNKGVGKGDAVASLNRAVKLERELYGPDDPDVAETLRLRARSRYEQGDRAGSRADHQEAIDVLSRAYGPDHWQLVGPRLELRELERIEALPEAAQKELAQAEKWLGDARKGLQPKKGQPAVAAALADKAFDVLVRHLGIDSLAADRCVSLAATLYQKANKRGIAGKRYDQVTSIRTRLYGEDHLETAKAMVARASERGNPVVAVDRLRKALPIYRRSLGEDHFLTLQVLSHLARDYGNLGEFAEAMPIRERILASSRRTMGNDHPVTAHALLSLGRAHMAQHDFARAAPLCEEAIAMRTKVFGPEHHSTLEAQMTLERCTPTGPTRATLERLAAAMIRAFGPEWRRLAFVYDSLTLMAIAGDDLAAAHALSAKSMAIHRKQNADNASLSYGLDALGALLAAEGKLDEARMVLEESLAQRRKYLGPQHPKLSSTLDALGRVKLQAGDRDGALTHFLEAVRIQRSHLDLVAAGLSERQQLLAQEKMNASINRFLSVPGLSVAQFAQGYDEVLALKGSVFDRQRQARLDRSDPALVPLTTELRSIATRLAHLTFSSASEDDEEDEGESPEFGVKALSDRKEVLERELAAKSSTFRHERELDRLTSDGLRRLLPSTVALVDFVGYNQLAAGDPVRRKKSGEARLAAVILRPNLPLTRVDLGPAQPIRDAIERWRSMTRASHSETHPGVELRRRLWEPIAKHLAGAETVLITPSPALAQLPFAALPGSKPDTYLLEETRLAVVPMPRLVPELLAPLTTEPEHGSTPQKLLLVGDVDFDAPQGPPSATRQAERKAWAHLDGTRAEVLAIRDSFEQRFGAAHATLLRGPLATETAFRETGPQHAFLHLATHGFFTPEETSSIEDETSDPDWQTGRPTAITHPGLRSGIVLAGANRAPASGLDDGILTALEVAELDLKKTELVVLSACETGLGRSAGREGLLGLQRSFQFAGARTVIASLWSVDDVMTQQLMAKFYENLWVRNLSKAESLRQAQLFILREGPRRGLIRLQPSEPQVSPPYYWAAFVVSGDWR